MYNEGEPQVSMEAEQNYVIFFKALNREDLVDTKGGGYIPGTVTSDPNEALDWYYRYHVPEGINLKGKEYGPKRHIRRGQATIIALQVDTSNLQGADEFQKSGLSEHERENCWTGGDMTKAQINTPITRFVELSDEELFSLSRPGGEEALEKIKDRLSG